MVVSATPYRVKAEMAAAISWRRVRSRLRRRGASPRVRRISGRGCNIVLVVQFYMAHTNFATIHETGRRDRKPRGNAHDGDLSRFGAHHPGPPGGTVRDQRQ